MMMISQGDIIKPYKLLDKLLTIYHMFICPKVIIYNHNKCHDHLTSFSNPLDANHVHRKHLEKL